MEEIIHWCRKKGYEINQPELLIESMIHTSFMNEQKDLVVDNERLELLGDAVLQLWVSTRLFKVKPSLSEGQMTTMRSRLVNEASLADFTRELGIQDFLKLGHGEEKNGGRNRDSILANLFEAFLGALYLQDSTTNIDLCLNQVIGNRFDLLVNQENNDYKTRLQEYVQADTRKTVVYDVIESNGPPNNPVFEVVVKLDGLVLGKGKGNSKKKAEQQAAKDAFSKLVR